MKPLRERRGVHLLALTGGRRGRLTLRRLVLLRTVAVVSVDVVVTEAEVVTVGVTVAALVVVMVAVSAAVLTEAEAAVDEGETVDETKDGSTTTTTTRQLASTGRVPESNQRGLSYIETE